MTDKEIETFVNWLQSCTAKKFYSADAEDLIFEFKNQAFSQHDVIKNEVAVCCENCTNNHIDFEHICSCCTRFDLFKQTVL